METMKNFMWRCQQATGKTLDELPVLSEMPPFGGHIFVARGNLLVVGVGYPAQEEEDGSETWSEFAVVKLR